MHKHMYVLFCIRMIYKIAKQTGYL